MLTYLWLCEHTYTRCLLFFNFQKMDLFLRLRLAQRLLPLRISHLSLISLGMDVCIMVCIFVCVRTWVCVCLPCYRCLCSLMGDRNKNKSISPLNHTLSSTTWQLTTAVSVSVCVRIHVYVCNLITQQLTGLHNRYLMISLNLSVVYFGSD